LKVTIFRMDAIFKEVTNLNVLETFSFSPNPMNSLNAILKAVTSIALIKRQMRKYAETLHEVIQQRSGTEVENSAVQRALAMSLGTPQKDSKPNSQAAPGNTPVTSAKNVPAGVQTERFAIGQTIKGGISSSCRISAGTDRQTGKPVILKLLHCAGDFNTEIREEISNHQLAMNCKVPNIIELIGCVVSESQGYWHHAGLQVGMAFPVAQPLSEVFLEQSVEEIAGILCDIGCALKAMHGIGLIHYDVSIDNIVLEPTSKRAMLIDFGHSVLTNPLSRIPFDNGTIGYAAPECFEGEWCVPQSDLYNLGVCGLIMVARHLVEAKEQRERLSCNWARPDLREDLKEWLLELASALFNNRAAPKPLRMLCSCVVQMMKDDPHLRPYPQEKIFKLVGGLNR
jgi:serine/threonine protein kinase